MPHSFLFNKCLLNIFTTHYNAGTWYQTSIDYSNTDSGDSVITFDASKSNPIYGNSNTVQPQAIQYPYYIVLATGVVTDIKVRQELTTNNPFTLFESKYSDIEINNTSWLLSTGQWNSGDVYVSAYEALVKDYNNENKLGVKLHTETYDDYDFVLNQQDKIFRLPILNGAEQIPGHEVEMILTDSSATAKNLLNDLYTPTRNGFLTITSDSALPNVTAINTITNTANTGYGQSANAPYATIFASKGQQVRYIKSAISSDGSTTRVYFTYAVGNGSLYYYVGETNINVSLVNVGKLSNELNVLHKQKMDKQGNATVIKSYKSGTSWYRVWSDGWCEQGGINSSSQKGSITFLQPFKDTNYTFNATIVNSDYGAVYFQMTIHTQTTSNISYVSTIGSTRTACPFHWYACGYIL